MSTVLVMVSVAALGAVGLAQAQPPGITASPSAASPGAVSPMTSSPTATSGTAASATAASGTTSSPTAGSPTAASPTAESRTIASPAAASRTTASPTAASPTAPSVSRIAGADRYATSAAASRAAFPTGTSPAVVYLVSGTSPWESLSATPAAVAQDGGVLLTRPDGIPSSTATELKRLAPESIVVVGSTSAISDTVLGQAASYADDVQRVGGGSRYQTAQALVRHAFPAGSQTHAWIATGADWTGAIVASAAAASHREPLITIDGSAASLPSATLSLIRDLGLTTVTITGGTSAVSTGIEAQLDDLLGDSEVIRAGGSDQYAVSARVNALAFPALDAGTAYLANGRDFVNALGGAFLAGRTKRPLQYTVPFCVPAAVRPALIDASVTKVVLLGGEGSVRGLVGTLEACRSISTASSVWVLVNKRNALAPKSYVPGSLTVPSVTYPNGQRLRSDAAAALARMFTAARSEGAGRMMISSGYRSYATQSSLYSSRVASRGRAYADQWVGRPGYSEHQTGLGLDIAPVGSASCSTFNCIGSTAQGVWLRKNSWRFGFVLRYESGNSSMTGYGSEPWHFRYVGTALATGYHKGGWHSLEQFLGEPAAPGY